MRIWHKGIDSVHAFYVNGLLRSLFLSMTTIFVPLFLYTLGVKTWGVETYGLLMVVGYFMLERAVVISLAFPISKLIEKIGFRKSISLAILFLIGYNLSFLLAEKDFRWVVMSAICGGINILLYWISRDSALSQDIESKNMGKKIGYIIVLENIAGLLGPFAGGAIVLTFGYTALFIAGFAILLLSTIPLWWMPPHSHKNGVSLEGFWYFLTNGRYLHQVVASFGVAINDYGNGVIWPLIIFLQGINHAKLGAIYSMVGIVAIGVQYLSGKWFDFLRSRKDYADEGVYAVSVFGVATAWLVRIFAHSWSQIIPLDMGRQIFGTVYSNFFSDYLHLGGKRMGSIAYWVYLEIVYSTATLFIFGVMAVGIYFGNWKELVLITLSLWSLATVVIARESNMK